MQTLNKHITVTSGTRKGFGGTRRKGIALAKGTGVEIKQINGRWAKFTVCGSASSSTYTTKLENIS